MSRRKSFISLNPFEKLVQHLPLLQYVPLCSLWYLRKPPISLSRKQKTDLPFNAPTHSSETGCTWPCTGLSVGLQLRRYQTTGRKCVRTCFCVWHTQSRRRTSLQSSMSTPTKHRWSTHKDLTWHGRRQDPNKSRLSEMTKNTHLQSWCPLPTAAQYSCFRLSIKVIQRFHVLAQTHIITTSAWMQVSSLSTPTQKPTGPPKRQCVA